jgi:hypothetical protein
VRLGGSRDERRKAGFATEQQRVAQEEHRTESDVNRTCQSCSTPAPLRVCVLDTQTRSPHRRSAEWKHGRLHGGLDLSTLIAEAVLHRASSAAVARPQALRGIGCV